MQVAVDGCRSHRKAEHSVSMAENVQLGAGSFASSKELVSRLSAALENAEHISLFTREVGHFKSRSLLLHDWRHVDTAESLVHFHS